MRQVTLDELYTLADAAREDIWDTAKGYARDPKIYLHWSAGHYGTKFDDYHINIDADGNLYASTDNLADTLAHTWRRNSGAIGIALDCCVDATSEDLGPEPPTAAQIEAMAQAVWKLADALDLTIDKERVMTHGEAADNEDGLYTHDAYGPKNTCERWDLEYLGTDESPSFNPWATDGTRGGDVLRGKANWYRENAPH